MAIFNGGNLFRLPASEVATGLTQEQLAQGNDEAGIFSQGDEFAGLDHADARMTPARQRFGADDLTALARETSGW